MDIVSEKYGGRDATRAKIVSVFNRLLLEGASPRPRVAQVISEAGIARSTFYDHFDGIEALSHESLAVLFAAIADCLVGRDDQEQLDSLLNHVWMNRALGRELLTGTRGERSEALLAKIIEDRIEAKEQPRLIAILIAGTVMSGLSGWAIGRINTPPDQMARTLRRTALAILSDSERAKED